MKQEKGEPNFAHLKLYSQFIRIGKREIYRRVIHGKSRITRVWRQEGKQTGTTVVERGRGYFSAASWPGARFVDRMLGLTDANVADIAGYC